MFPNGPLREAIARCCRGRVKPAVSMTPGPAFLRSQRERLESLDGHGGYLTGAPHASSFLQTK